MFNDKPDEPNVPLGPLTCAVLFGHIPSQSQRTANVFINITRNRCDDGHEYEGSVISVFSDSLAVLSHVTKSVLSLMCDFAGVSYFLHKFQSFQ